MMAIAPVRSETVIVASVAMLLTPRDANDRNVLRFNSHCNPRVVTPRA